MARVLALPGRSVAVVMRPTSAIPDFAATAFAASLRATGSADLVIHTVHASE